MEKVVVTGLGVVSAIGENIQNFWNALKVGCSGVQKISYFDASNYRSQIAAQLKAFSIENYIGSDTDTRLPLPSQYAIAATTQAINDAQLDVANQPGRIGICLGTGLGGTYFGEDAMHRLYQSGPRKIHPLTALYVDPNTLSSRIAIHWGLKGPQTCISNACSSSGHALGMAAMMIKCGRADVMIAGGAEAPISPLLFAGFDRMSAMSQKNDTPEIACAPFASHRDGFVMGEGGGILILESEAHAKKRGARVYAELSGYGANGGAFHPVQPEVNGEDAAMAMQLALGDAGVDSDAVDIINPHGTATLQNDASEARALYSVFGERLSEIPITPTKHLTGHLLGGAGAIEAVHAVLSLHHQTVTPIGYDTKGSMENVPALKFERSVMHQNITTVVSNSFGFGNNNASIVFRR